MRKYGISGLVEMAQEKVSGLAADLCASDIISLTADASSLFHKDDLWLSAFIDSPLKKFLKDMTPSTRTDFLGHFGHTTAYPRMLVDDLLRICRDNLDPVVNCGQPAPSVRSVSPSTDYVQCTPESTLFDVGESTTASGPRVEQAGPESEVGITADLESEATAPAWDHDNNALDTPATKEVEEVDAPPEDPEHVIEEGDIDCWAPITKSKKKKKKKKGGKFMEPAVSVCPDSAPEATTAVECKDDEWGVAARKA